MTANIPKLTEIDPNTIFEQFNVSEVVDIHRKIFEQIENKNQDLKTMVGERYRDFIIAADTIGEMKETSARVGSNIQGIIDSCVSLNDQQLLGFKSSDNRQKQHQSNLYSVLIEIKILTITPEIIWTAIEAQQFFTAAQLFIFSRHICTGLKLNNQTTDILNTFPVARKQWDVLNSFFFVIKRSCYKKLESKKLERDVAINCLASLMILENANLNTILQNFIQLRGKAFFNCLSDHRDDESEEGGRKVKDKILESINILNETILLAHECFIQNGVINLLSTLLNDQARPTVRLIESELGLLSHLSDIIVNFYPKPNLEALKEETIRTTMSTWQTNIENYGKNQLKEVIGHITSIKMIHTIRSIAANAEKAPQWSEICASLFLSTSLDVYATFYKPLITDCVKRIIDRSWDAMLHATSNQIEMKIFAADGNQTGQLQKAIWTEDFGDLPRSLKEAIERETVGSRLLLSKTDGYIPAIVEICSNLDEGLGRLHEDFRLYVTSKTAERDGESEMLGYFKETCFNRISQLIGDIKTMKQKSEKINCILLAKTLQGISQLCPNLRNCSTFNIDFQSDPIDYWLKIKSLLEEECQRFWKLWVDEFPIENYLATTDIDLNFMLRDLPNWEYQTIIENDEQQNPVETKIRIPTHPSLLLQQFLHSMCQALNKNLPHTIPSSINTYFIEKMLNHLLSVYRELIEQEFVRTNQNAALQFYFDVKFLATILVGSRNKNPAVNDESKRILDKLRTLIDPFDFELFFKYLTDNVRRCGLGMQNELGCLTQVLQDGTKTSPSQGTREPNILALCSNANTSSWFPLLPIVNVNTGMNVAADVAVQDSKVKSTKTLKTSSSSSSLSTATQNYANNVKSGAAALFGSMTQEWFKS